MAEKKVRVTVDRIEYGRLAVLSVHGGGQWILPVKHLPAGAREGATFDVTWKRNAKAERALRAEVASLQRALQARSRKK
jgi:hypothetical protein